MPKDPHPGNAPPRSRSPLARSRALLASTLPLGLAAALTLGGTLSADGRPGETAAGVQGSVAADTVRVVEEDGERVYELRVTATAYNTLPEQTHHLHPDITAFGDTLRPGMNALAVSRDLEAMGLGYGTEVEIPATDTTWVVRDRTHYRWSRRVDLYMGTDLKGALEWGRREVTIRWRGDSPSDRPDGLR